MLPLGEIVAILSCLVPPAIAVGKCFKKPLNYLCCLKTNLKDLEEASRDLKNDRDGLHMRVKEGKGKGKQILPAVETWISKADETQANNCQILATPIPGNLSLKKRYSLSRKAKKAAESIVVLQGTSKFDRIYTDTPSCAEDEIASRKQIADNIIKALRDREGGNVIGVFIAFCGMGGIGKTVIAKQIMYRARKEGLFSPVLTVDVGQQADMLNIQHEIAKQLKLEFKVTKLRPRAQLLQKWLMGGKRALILIDDVRDRIDLESLGIPMENGSCTVLLTSRNMGVFDQMGVQAIIPVDISYEEQWFMLEENVREGMNVHLLPTDQVHCILMSGFSVMLILVYAPNCILFLGLIACFLLVMVPIGNFYLRSFSRRPDRLQFFALSLLHRRRSASLKLSPS